MMNMIDWMSGDFSDPADDMLESGRGFKNPGLQWIGRRSHVIQHPESEVVDLSFASLKLYFWGRALYGGWTLLKKIFHYYQRWNNNLYKLVLQSP